MLLSTTTTRHDSKSQNKRITRHHVKHLRIAILPDRNSQNIRLSVTEQSNRKHYYLTMEIKKTETSNQRICRKTKNVWIRSLGFCEKSELLAKMKLKNEQLKGCKKIFGVRYMDLIESGASANALDLCVETSRQEISVFKAEIMGIKTEIAHIDKKTSDKLHQKPEHQGQGSGMKFDEAVQRGFVPTATPVYETSSQNFV
jgi:hypothetical protein